MLLQASKPRQILLSQDYTAPTLVDPNAWTLPAGAFGENAGPTSGEKS